MTIVTPFFAQYQGIKEQYPDCLLFFRLGDFYELFAEDAKTASRELSLVLTARECGGGQKTPMCGVPHHAVDNYVARLIERGYKVAICEQLEDPKKVKRGIVKRDVIRVITPGTVMEENMLEGNAPNYLAAVWVERKGRTETGFGLAYTDITTGSFFAGQISGGDIRNKLADELTRISPTELLLPDDLLEDELFRLRLLDNCVGCLTPCPEMSYVARNREEILMTQFEVANMEALGLGELPLAVYASAMVLTFLETTQKRTLHYINQVKIFDGSKALMLDSATRRNLELTATLRGGKRKGSLLWVLDDTLTAMGARLLREWLDNPLLSHEAVNLRLGAVEELTKEPLLLSELRGILKDIPDMQRLVTQVSYNTAGPRVLLNIKRSLAIQPRLFALLNKLSSPLLQAMVDSHDMLEDVCSLLEKAIDDDAPISPKDTGVIKDGFDPEVDELRHIALSSKQLLLDLETRERERTGIRTLKVGYNKVFGYYIEISKGKADEAPEDYIRKQTLVNGERFITPELKELEEKMVTAAERLADIEYKHFCEVRNTVADAAARIKRTADICAALDALQSLASVAIANNYCRPQVDDGSKIIITEGRHPVVE
ncbi:MAG: DNA mismatch repair protein MutS, partial [Firmicutes bacterium]|nr:DNA mismatch repair protein MutS [Bacillota bacterium]